MSDPSDYKPGDKFRRTRANGVIGAKWRLPGYVGIVESLDDGFQGLYPGIIDTNGHWHALNAIERV